MTFDPNEPELDDEEVADRVEAAIADNEVADLLVVEFGFVRVERHRPTVAAPNE